VSAERDMNQKIIEEFRANGGQVRGRFAGAPMLLLHHTGRRSGVERVNPMMYQQVGEAYAVFASKAGADVDPDWYHNLRANPEAIIEVGTRRVPVRARVLDQTEREPIWRTQKSRYPGFQAYEDKTDRTIPVILLEPRET
jgi:deazaflavin-dependent oxidoreductase (nitroreductase family)